MDSCTLSISDGNKSKKGMKVRCGNIYNGTVNLHDDFILFYGDDGLRSERYTKFKWHNGLTIYIFISV